MPINAKLEVSDVTEAQLALLRRMTGALIRVPKLPSSATESATAEVGPGAQPAGRLPIHSARLRSVRTSR
jgi:hypothetical protein